MNGGAAIGMHRMTSRPAASHVNRVFEPASESGADAPPEVPIPRDDGVHVYGESPDDDVGAGSPFREEIAINVRCIRQLLRLVEHRLDCRMHHDTNQQLVKRDWRKASLILDRFFFVLYLFLIIVSIATLFPRP